MTTATKTFTRAIQVSRSDTGCYGFICHQSVTDRAYQHGLMSFHEATGYMGRRFDWEIVEELTGWGDWTHAIRVTYGDRDVYYFAR